MPNKTFRPLTPSTRYITIADYSDITKTQPKKSLVEIRKKTDERSHFGSVTVCGIVSDYKQKLCLVDCKGNKDELEATVAALKYGHLPSDCLTLLQYADGEKRYKVAKIKKLEEELSKKMGKEVYIDIVEVKPSGRDEQLVADNITFQFERRVSFRSTKKKDLQTTKEFGAGGIDVHSAERLGRTEMARVNALKSEIKHDSFLSRSEKSKRMGRDRKMVCYNPFVCHVHDEGRRIEIPAKWRADKSDNDLMLKSIVASKKIWPCFKFNFVYKQRLFRMLSFNDPTSCLSSKIENFGIPLMEEVSYGRKY